MIVFYVLTGLQITLYLKLYSFPRKSCKTLNILAKSRYTKIAESKRQTIGFILLRLKFKGISFWSNFWTLHFVSKLVTKFTSVRFSKNSMLRKF